MDPIGWLILLIVALAGFIWWVWRKSRVGGSNNRVSNRADTPLPSLVCIQGPLAGRSFPFKRTWLAIGRDRDNDVVIEGSLVSRHHAMLTAISGGVVLSDLGSTNGTWVAGRRILEQPLAENDAIQIGPCIFVLAVPGRAAFPQRAPSPVTQSIPSVSISMARSVEIGSYERVELIGEGGAAFVYKMRHHRTHELAALKILKESADPYFKRRFSDEGAIGLQLLHPYIVTVYGIGESYGIHYILMEYLAGNSLRDQIGQPIALQRATATIGQICEALDFAHSHGVFHRDIKPENILFTQAGAAKIADFGIARLTGMRRITREGMIIGTPEYMSFEQAKGMGLDGRSDQYSLGIVLYEMLTGQPPFTDRDPLKVVEMHLERSPIPPRKLNPAIPPQTESVIMRALNKDRRRRYPTMAGMAAALGYRIGAMPGQASRARQTPPQARSVRLIHLANGQTWPLGQAGVVLGREMLGDPNISRRHARIQQNGHAYTIEDLGSTNGTFVEGQRIATTTVLSPGARIHLGPVPFQFLVDEPSSGGRRLT